MTKRIWIRISNVVIQSSICGTQILSKFDVLKGERCCHKFIPFVCFYVYIYLTTFLLKFYMAGSLKKECFQVYMFKILLYIFLF